jgi:hypothetical protein
MLAVLDLHPAVETTGAIRAVAMLRVSMVEETQLDTIRDHWRAVQKLLNHIPRIVENQQRLGPRADPWPGTAPRRP